LVLVLALNSLALHPALAQKASSRHETITVFAAAGIRPATETLCRQFEKKMSCRVFQNYASSGTLARQIDNGADCDVFISANKQWIDFLVDKGLVAAEAVHALAGARLVVIAPAGSTISAPVFSADFDIRGAIPDKIALGDPAYVPAGKYAQQVLSRLGWEEPLKEKTILAKDVSAVLHYVALGECDWGIVYETEALGSKKVTIIATVPEHLHEPIVFYCADLKAGQKLGQALTELLLSKTGRAVLTDNGFTSPERK
jgi:molybdate transport system substrate-binding protein